MPVTRNGGLSIVFKLMLMMLAASLAPLFISENLADRILDAFINTAVNSGLETGDNALRESDEILRNLAKKNLGQLAESRATEVNSAISEAEAALTITSEFLERIFLRDFYKSWPLYNASELPEDKTQPEPAGSAMTFSDRHNRRITFTGSSWQSAPDNVMDEISSHLKRYQPLSYVNQLLYRQIPHVLWFMFISREGMLFNYPGTSSRISRSDPRSLLWYRDAITQKGIRWTPVQEDSDTGALTAICYMSVFAPGDDLIGVMALEVSIDDVIERVTSSHSTGLSRVMLLDPWGKLTGMHMDEVANLSWDGNVPQLETNLSGSSAIRQTPFGNRTGFGTCVLDGNTSYIAYSPIPRLRWSIAVITPEEDVLKPVTVMEKRITEGVQTTSEKMQKELSFYRHELISIRYWIAFGSMLLAFFISKIMFRPLGDLADVADRISKGDFNARTTTRRKDEIGLLGNAMNSMARSIQILIAELRHSNRSLERKVQEISNLYEFSMTVTDSLKLEEVAHSAVSITSKSFGAPDVVLFVLSTDGAALKAATIYGQEYRKAVGRELEITDELKPYLNGLIVRDEKSGRPVIEFIDEICGTETTRAILCPLVTPGGLVGLLMAGAPGRTRPFRAGDFRLFRGFAVQAGSAVENACLYAEVLDKKKIEHELDIASRIQRDILPQSFPDVTGLAMAGFNLPALQVGGDFFDVFPMAGGRTGFVIADVSGKGMPAALLMALSRATIRAQVMLSDSPKDVLERTNRLLAPDIKTGMFITAYFAVYDPADCSLRFSNAGHNPPVMFSGDGKQTLLHIQGIALGVLPEITLNENVVTLKNDDLVVFYTDGITDTMSEDMQPMGMMPMIKCIGDSRSEKPSLIIEKIIDLAHEYAGDSNQFDDITLMLLRRTDEPSPERSIKVKKTVKSQRTYGTKNI